MRLNHLFAALAALGVNSLASAVETVRVDAASGAPRIVVDGRPVRARIFWGAPGSRPVKTGPEARLISFDFKALHDEPAKATMHFRFGQTPGEIRIDDIRIVDLATGKEICPTSDFEGGEESFSSQWLIWPPPEKNTVGTVRVEPGQGREGSAGLRITLRAPAVGDWPDFHIHHRANLALREGQAYRVSFWVKSEPARDVTVAFYRPGANYTFLGGPEGVFEQQIKLAAGAGVDMVSFPLPLPWPRPGAKADFAAVDSACQAVLDANPKALLLPRIGMNPPAWWFDAHPGDAMVWDAPAQGHKWMAVASPACRRDAAERLTALVAHVEEKFGPHVAGYHPSGQNTGEWFYEGTWARPLNGYAPADAAAWTQWLKDQNRADVPVPSPAARRASPAGALRDPVAERELIDFARFQQEMMADCVCALARAVRQASHGRKLVLFFYGYAFEFGPVANGPATSGHYALRRVLDCPDIDVLCSPISYFDRALGQSGPAMTAAESVALAGKMWLSEDDTRTYLGTGTFPGWKDGADTIEDTNRLLLRNTAQCAVRNFATWWMDLGASGWFNDARMWEQMTLLKTLDQPLLETPLPYRPQVAAVIDEASMLRLTPAGQPVSAATIYESRRALGRMGAAYGQYLLDDVTRGRVQARVYVMLNAWCLSPEQRRDLFAATKGAMRIWCYAPGLQEPDRLAPEAMAGLTGLQLKPAGPVNALAEPTAAGKRLGLIKPLGLPRRVTPLFAAADAAGGEVLATYSDGSAAIALRQTADGWSLFVGPPGLSADLLRLAAGRAVVHLFTSTDCNVYANGPYLVLHAPADGPIEIDTARPDPIRDVLTGQTLGDGPKLTWNARKGETRVLHIGTERK